MKKFIIISLLILFTVGCVRVDTSNVDYIVDKIIVKDKKLNNEQFNGFSMYIPKGIKIVNKDDNNIILSDEYKNYYYVYVDVVSFYNKSKNTYKEDNSLYFSRKFNNKTGKKSGYLEIDDKNDKFFVQGVYNYVKIEVYSKKNALNDVLLNTGLILSSVKYNRKAIETTIGDKALYYKEQSFNIFARDDDSNYLDYVEKYDSGAADKDNVKKKSIDDDIIDTDILED